MDLPADQVRLLLTDQGIEVVARPPGGAERRIALRVAIDRDRCCRVLRLEEYGKRPVSVAVDPLVGLRGFHMRRLGAAAGGPPAIEDLARRLYAAMIDLDAERIELTPVVIAPSGAALVCGAALRLDPRAGFRHKEWASLTPVPEGTDLERAVRPSGAVAVEINPEGDVVAAMSGAGLMMATLDMLSGLKVRPRCVVDMGGTPLGGADGLVPIFRALAALKPRVTFVNAYFHTARAEVFAQGILDTARIQPFAGRLILRLKGRNAEIGRAMLRPLGFETHEELEPALATVAHAARAAA